MKKISALILNLPWSIVGIILAIISCPIRAEKCDKVSLVFCVKVNKVWLIEIFHGKRIRGVTLGNVILLSDIADETTISHELVHIKQFENRPFAFMFLYFIELAKHGYEENIYEIEARNL